MKNKTKKLKSIHVIIICIIVISLIAILFYNMVQIKEEGITAMEGYEKAEAIALEWNATAELVEVNSFWATDYEGNSSAWSYTFYDSQSQFISDSGSFMYFKLFVKIYSNGTVFEREFSGLQSHVIESWNIDSNESYQIALENEQVSTFVSSPTAELQSLELNYFYNQTCWNIIWKDLEFYEEDRSYKLLAYINASNGEIVSIELY